MGIILVGGSDLYIGAPCVFCILCFPKLPMYGYVGAGMGMVTPLLETWDGGMLRVHISNFIYTIIYAKKEN